MKLPDEVKEAIRTLNDFCGAQKDCNNCPFRNKINQYNYCNLAINDPHYWFIDDFEKESEKNDE